MAVLSNCKLWLGSYDLSGDMNSLTYGIRVPMLNDTVFGDTTMSNAPGIPSLRFGHAGIWRAASSGSPDNLFSSAFGVADTVMTACVSAGATGDAAVLARVLTADYTPLTGKVGDQLEFSVGGEVSGGFATGVILLSGTKTSTSTSTPVQVGAVPAGKSVYASLHVLAASGTLDVVVQSDDSAGFGSPANVITFSQKAAIGSDWSAAAGAITDDYWRISYTIGGGSPSFQFIVALGIR